MNKLLILLLVFFLAPQAHADVCSGRELLQNLTQCGNSMFMSKVEHSNCALAEGYVYGVVDTYEEFNMPDRTTYTQIARVAKKWLQEHPENLDQPASLLIRRCLIETYGRK